MSNKTHKLLSQYVLINSCEESRRGDKVGYGLVDYVFKPKSADLRTSNNYCLTTEYVQRFYYGEFSGYDCFFEVNQQ